MNIFEFATRAKVRFRHSSGLISVEDLWDLTLPQLDSIAKALRKTLQDNGESFISETKTDKTTEIAFDVVKYIIGVKLAEREAMKRRKEAAEKRAQILDIIADKQNAAMKEKSVEELMKELENLSS